MLYRASTVPTYLEGDWFRDWGALQRLDPFYPNAQPARLDLGTATRSGLWSPAPLRPTSQRHWGCKPGLPNATDAPRRQGWPHGIRLRSAVA